MTTSDIENSDLTYREIWTKSTLIYTEWEKVRTDDAWLEFCLSLMKQNPGCP